MLFNAFIKYSIAMTQWLILLLEVELISNSFFLLIMFAFTALSTALPFSLTYHLMFSSSYTYGLPNKYLFSTNLSLAQSNTSSLSSKSIVDRDQALNPLQNLGKLTSEKIVRT